MSAGLVAVFGATSAIAVAHARILAARGARFVLVARRGALLEEIAADLRVRGAASVTTRVQDLDATTEHRELVDWIRSEGDIELAVIAQGVLGSQERANADSAHVVELLQANFVAPASLLTELARAMEPRGRGTIAVISSVAGERGRASNFAYGSAKAGLTAFASGLRQRVRRSGLRVVTIKPGFVDTPMTAQMRKGPLWATPEAVARRIDRAVSRGTPVAYAPSWWALVACALRAVPERLFMRLRA